MKKQEIRKYADRRTYLKAAVQRRRTIVRQKAIAYGGGKCEICGYSRCPEALEFHHKEVSSKDFGIPAKGYTRSWARVIEEIEKCVLVCANCHREIHAGIAAFPGNRD